MTATYEIYDSTKTNFLERHNYDYRVYTSSQDEYGRWYKEYICEDGAIFTECYSPVYETAEVTVKGLKFTQDVKLLRTEFYSNDGVKSQYLYERW